MPRLVRRAKKIHKIRFADGQIFTILDVDPDPQTGDVTLMLKRSVGEEILLIPAVIVLAVMVGWNWGATGIMVALIGGGVGGIALIRYIIPSRGIISRTLPSSSVIGFDNYFQLKSKSYCFCCHTFDSSGNPVLHGSDPIAIMENQLNEREWMIKFLRDQVMTLRYNVYEMLKSRKELSDEVAGELKKMIESTVTQVKTRVERPAGYPPYPSEYPSPNEEEEI